jgi:uncharacterized protein YbjT (DUF2867 family)
MGFQNIVVIGGAGNLGVVVVPILLEAGLKVTALIRPKSQSTFPENVEVKKADYTFESLKSIFAGKDAVVNLVGNTGLSEEKIMVDAAAAARVKWFIPSEFGHDTTNPMVTELLDLFQVKVQVVQYLRTKEKEGLSWTSLLTGFFFDWGLPVGLLGYDLQSKKARIWDDGNNRVNLSTLRTIGLAIAQILTDPTIREDVRNQYVRISSVSTTQNEITAALEHVSGSKFELSHISSGEGKRIGQEKMAKGELSDKDPDYDPSSGGLFLLLQYVAFGDQEFVNWEKPGPFYLPVKDDSSESVLDIVKRVYEKLDQE